MFTGLVEKVGRLVARGKETEGTRLTVEHEPWDLPLRPGESLAVQGVCLTVVAAEASQFFCHTLEETLARTTLGKLPIGSKVNLERALRVGDRLGGHWVTGHVDDVGWVQSLQRRGPDRVLRVACEAPLLADLVVKGCVACDGVSLTVTAVDEAAFEVHIIPYTWEHTSLRDLRTGSGVNVETDLVAKYVRQRMRLDKTPAEGTGSARWIRQGWV